MTDLTRRIESLVEENKRLKDDANSMKDRFRELENDYNTTIRKLDEKGRQI